MTIDEVLEKAAASTDPAVRNQAIRYRKIKIETEGLEAFFSCYAQALAETPNGAPAAIIVPRRAAAVPGRPAPAVPGDVFAKLVGSTLTAYGKPLKIGKLYDLFCEKHPDVAPTSAATFRQKLFKQRDKIKLIEGEGYWPADVALTGGIQ